MATNCAKLYVILCDRDVSVSGGEYSLHMGHRNMWESKFNVTKLMCLKVWLPVDFALDLDEIWTIGLVHGKTFLSVDP